MSKLPNWTSRSEGKAAVSCSPTVYKLGGVRFGSEMTGKLGLAWVGAWVVVVGYGACLF